MKKLIISLLVLLLLCGCSSSKEEDIEPSIDIKEGSYYDSVSQRATLTVSKTDEGYYLVVSWAQSSSQTNTWAMECKVDENKLVYQGETTAVYTYDDDGNEMVADGATNCAGYFEIEDSKILWTGACEEYLKACVFEIAE